MDEVSLKREVNRELKRYRNLPIIKHVLVRLGTELPKTLCYHTAAHTDDVMHETLLFAVHDKLDARSRELLMVAAAYHDSGFIVGSVEHEKTGVAIFEESLEKFSGYQSEEQDLIKRMILDTKLIMTKRGFCQAASTELSKYLLDADLSNFGRPDFFEKLELVRSEMGASRDRFLESTLDLVLAHQWFTSAALALRTKEEERNVQLLKEVIAQSRIS